jgi:hypothetical protein
MRDRVPYRPPLTVIARGADARPLVFRLEPLSPRILIRSRTLDARLPNRYCVRFDLALRLGAMRRKATLFAISRSLT